MTKCVKNEVNLKSTAYNPTGQNYFEQLAAYNSMSQHLRRILLAKSMVDTKNKNYMCRKNRRSKPSDDRRICSFAEMTDDIIDRLAYDTQHHPMDVLKIKANPQCLGCCDYNLEHRQSRNCGRPCCRASSQTARRQRSTSRSQRSTSPVTASKRKRFIPNTVCGMESKTARKSPYVIDSSVGLLRQRKFRYETDPAFVSCTTTTLDPSGFKQMCLSPTQETNDHRSVSSRISRNHDDSDHDDKAVDRLASRQEDEKKYVNFIYGITKEIKQNGLYTDKELRDVFKEHVDKNKGILDMSRMLYEIYQLKISLNILDDGSDIDDELEDLIHAQTLLHISEIRPPTPPKVLNENKVIEKLQAYQKSMAQNRELNDNPTKKVVMSTDFDPDAPIDFEWLLTLSKAEIAMMMLEQFMQIRAQREKLQAFSSSNQAITQNETVKTEEKIGQEESDIHTIESGSKASEFVNSEEESEDNRRVSLKDETIESCRASVDDRSIDVSAKQDANSSTSNPVSMQDQAVETENLIESD